MKIVSIYFLVGIVLGIIYGLLKSIIFVFKNHIAIQIICDFLFTIIFGATIIVLNNYYFYGEFRVYLLVSTFLGMIVELKTINKIFAKLFFLLYNKVSKCVDMFKSTRLGKILFK